MFLPLVFVKLNVVFKTQFLLHMLLEVRATVAYLDTVSFAAISLIDMCGVCCAVFDCSGWKFSLLSVKGADVLI